MKGSEGVQDILPGQHTYGSVFGFKDLANTPRFTEIKGLEWIPNEETGKGTLKFPSDFDGNIAEN